ncbi:putative membrane protein [Haloferula luteola]|uniref:Putative membrane protein n=1 Tax=Haloferula luteola TaxID=595692 RepID=A0A840V9M8_9BACT|nr:DUF4339 domain-containing protein [Haloferula luteola]MBB5351398.1 putative membrane protein [Haloferula luteola]
MNPWYYARSGKQFGPVPEPELERLARAGELDPLADLVWKEGMAQWMRPCEIPELIWARPSPTPFPSPEPAHNPYSVGEAGIAAGTPTATAPWVEIPPGSSQLEVGACISHAFQLTKRSFGTIIAVGAIYLGLIIGFGILQTTITAILGMGSSGDTFAEISTGSTTLSQQAPPAAQIVHWLLEIVSHVFSVFLGLGITRIGLNIVDSRPVEISMMFGESSKLIRALVAGFLYGIMVAIGLVLFIVPGIYLALRLGQYHSAIVDRDLSIADAFGYSSKITEGNRLNLFGLGLLSFLIVIAGVIALLVGLIFAYPIVWLAGLVAYRWLQYGPAVLQPPAHA